MNIFSVKDIKVFVFNKNASHYRYDNTIHFKD